MSLPTYKQLPNACGLSTFLMLINPEEHPQYAAFLQEIYDNIDFLIPGLAIKKDLLKEFKWSIVLDYILLKCLGRNELNSYLETIPEVFENYEIVTNYKLGDENSREVKQLPELFSELFFSFFESNLVNPYILRRSLFSLRTDQELKILFSLFGGKFLPQEQENYDGTGALYFSKEDVQSNNSVFYALKLKIIRKFLSGSNKREKHVIAANLGSHWVALSSIDEKFILVNDPASGKLKRFKFSKADSDRVRFYFFSYNLEDSFILKQDIKKFLIAEAEREFLQVKEFTKSLVKSADDLKRLAFEQIEEELTEKNIVVKTNEEISMPEPKDKDFIAKPLSSNDIMDRIRKKIKESFSDYSKL